MPKNSSGAPLVVASLILAASILGAGLLVRSSVDRAAAQLGEVLTALQQAHPPVRTARAPSRRGRPDPDKRYEVDISGAPSKGVPHARVTLVEFSDFQCPYCARVGPTLKRVEQEYGEDVSIVFKHLPLSIHPKAPAAHAAAEAAHRQGRFWEMHDRIFADQSGMSPERYEEYAQQLGLDMARYRADVTSGEVRSRVSADAAEAGRLGVTGTPAFFVNGRFLSGAQPFEAFQRVIDEELRTGG